MSEIMNGSWAKDLKQRPGGCDMRRVATVCASDVTISISGYDDGKVEEVTHAISAVPDMMKALEAMLCEIPSCSCIPAYKDRGRVDPQCVRCYVFGDELMGKAVKALAKAKGKER